VVDSLKRRVHEMHATTIIMYKSYLKEIILKAAKSDQQYMEIKENLQQGILQQKTKDYEMREDGTLLYKGRSCIPTSQELRNMIVRDMHNVPYVGDLGY
jgi:hypothetical protein